MAKNEIEQAGPHSLGDGAFTRHQKVEGSSLAGFQRDLSVKSGAGAPRPWERFASLEMLLASLEDLRIWSVRQGKLAIGLQNFRHPKPDHTILAPGAAPGWI